MTNPLRLLASAALASLLAAPALAQTVTVQEVPIRVLPAEGSVVDDTVAEPVETVIVPADEAVPVETVVLVEEETGGMPQLNAGTYPAQLFWFALIFAAFYFFLSRVALPRVSTVLEERHDRIANDLDQADLLNKRGQEALASYEQALAEARNSAAAIARQTRDEVSADIDRQTAALEADLNAKAEEAETRIQASRDEAMSHVGAIAADTAQAMVAQITGEEPARERAEAAVAQSLA